MSIDAVVSRIRQIVATERQLADPAAFTTDTAAVPPTGSSSFSNALAAAQGAAGQGAAGQGAAAQGGAAAQPLTAADIPVGSGPTRFQAMVQMANSLLGKPYIVGGGHAGFGPSAGYDCSGFVSAVLHVGGYLTQPVDTTALPNQPAMLSGPGQYVTIYDRALPGQSGHVIIQLGGQFYESGGMAGPWGGGGGVEKIDRPSASYLATFPTVLHPSGL